MAINLARIGGFEATPTKGFDPYEESRLQAEAQRQAKKAALDEQVGALNLANLQKQIAKEAIESGNAEKLKQVFAEDFKRRNAPPPPVLQDLPDAGKPLPEEQIIQNPLGSGFKSLNLNQNLDFNNDLNNGLGSLGKMNISKPEQKMPLEQSKTNLSTGETAVVDPYQNVPNAGIRKGYEKYDENETARQLAEIDPTAAQTFLTERMTTRNAALDRKRKLAQEDTEEGRKAAKELREIDKLAFEKTDAKEKNRIAMAAVTSKADAKINAQEAKIQAQKTKAEASKNGTIASFNRTLSVIDNLIGNKDKGIPIHPGLSGLTGLSSTIGVDVKQSTRDAEAYRTQLGAQSGFAALQEMRNNSPTGAALGPVSDLENKLLQASVVASQRGQSEEQFKKNLEDYRKTLLEVTKSVEDAYKKTYPEQINADDWK